MKIFFHFLCNFFFISLTAQWNLVGAAGISNGWTMYDDIATDTSGAPVVVFQDTPALTSPCLRYDGMQWQQVGAASFNFPFGGDQQLLIDRNNNFYLFFLNYYNSYPSCIKYDGNSWTYVGTQFIANEIINHVSMALDTSGILYIAYVGSNGFKLVRDNGSNWQTMVTNGAPSYLSYTSLQFDTDNTAYVAYCDGNTLKANCMKLSGSNWLPFGNANFSNGFAEYVKLNITLNHEFFVAFQDVQTKVLKFNSSNATWEQVGTSGLDGNYTAVEDLISDVYGNIYLSTSQIAADRARCLTYNGVNWNQIGATGISDTTAGFPNLAFDKSGNLFAIYNDWIIGKAVVKEYIGVIGEPEIVHPDLFSIAPNPANDYIMLMFNSNDLQKFDMKIVNSMGQIVREEEMECSGFSDNLMISVSDLSVGLYFLEIISKQSSATMRFQKY